MNKVIEHLDLSSVDGSQLNLDALYQIAPSVFTEACDPPKPVKSAARKSRPKVALV